MLKFEYTGLKGYSICPDLQISAFYDIRSPL